SAEAIASPMPELPPVTTATRPSSENSSARNPVMRDKYHTASRPCDGECASDPELSLNGTSTAPRPDLGEARRSHRRSPDRTSSKAARDANQHLKNRPGADQVQRVRGQPAAAGHGLHRRLLVLPGWQEAGDERVPGASAVDDPLDRGSGYPHRR